MPMSFGNIEQNMMMRLGAEWTGVKNSLGFSRDMGAIQESVKSTAVRSTESFKEMASSVTTSTVKVSSSTQHMATDIAKSAKAADVAQTHLGENTKRVHGEVRAEHEKTRHSAGLLGTTMVNVFRVVGFEAGLAAREARTMAHEWDESLGIMERQTEIRSRQMEREMGRFHRGVAAANHAAMKALSFTSTAGLGIGAGAAGAIYFGAKAAVGEQQQERQIQTTYGLTNRQLNTFSGFAQNNSAELLQNQASTIKGLAVAQQLYGTRTRETTEATEQLTEKSAKMSAMFGGTLTGDIGRTEGYLKTFGVTTKQMPQFLDEMARATQYSGKGMEIWGAGTGRAATVARSAGIDFGHFFSMVANLNREMPQLGPRAGAMVASLLQRLKTPSAALLKLFGDNMGKFREVVDLHKYGLEGSIRRIEELVARLKRSGNVGLALKLQSATMGVGIQQTIAERLASSRWRVGNARGTIDTGFGRVANTTANQFKRMQLSIEDMQLAVGRAFIPTIHQALDVVLPIVSAFGKWVQENPKLVKTIMQIAIAIGVVSAAVKVAMAAQMAFNALLVETNILEESSPVGLITVGVIALVAGIILLYNKWKPFRDFVNLAFADLKRFGTWLQTNLPHAFDFLKKSLQNMINYVQHNWKLVLFVALTWPLSLTIIALRKWGPDMLKMIVQGINIAKAWLAKNWRDVLKDTLFGPFALFMLALNIFFPNLRKQILNGLGNVLSDITKWATGLIASFLNWFGTIVSNIYNTLANSAKNIVKGAQAMMGKAINYITSLPGRAIHWGVSLAASLARGIENAAGQIATALLNAIKGAVGGAANWIKGHNPLGAVFSALGIGAGVGVPIGQRFVRGFASEVGPVSGSQFGFTEAGQTPGPTAYAGVANAIEHTDMQVSPGTPFKLPGGAGARYTLVQKYRSPGWGNTLTFMTPNDGFFDFMHMRSMSGVEVGGTYPGGTFLGTTGGVPGIDTSPQYSTGAHLHFGSDRRAYAYIFGIERGHGFDVGAPMAGAYLSSSTPGFARQGGGYGIGRGKPKTSIVIDPDSPTGVSIVYGPTAQKKGRGTHPHHKKGPSALTLMHRQQAAERRSMNIGSRVARAIKRTGVEYIRQQRHAELLQHENLIRYMQGRMAYFRGYVAAHPAPWNESPAQQGLWMSAQERIGELTTAIADNRDWVRSFNSPDFGTTQSDQWRQWRHTHVNAPAGEKIIGAATYKLEHHGVPLTAAGRTTGMRLVGNRQDAVATHDPYGMNNQYARTSAGHLGNILDGIQDMNDSMEKLIEATGKKHVIVIPGRAETMRPSFDPTMTGLNPGASFP